ncbi:MAG: hypothetical protein FWB72_01660 [Firmicutes bacterium]|nr:hypothetical protein [Bacillota bacterium]
MREMYNEGQHGRVLDSHDTTFWELIPFGLIFLLMPPVGLALLGYFIGASVIARRRRRKYRRLVRDGGFIANGVITEVRGTFGAVKTAIGLDEQFLTNTRQATFIRIRYKFTDNWGKEKQGRQTIVLSITDRDDNFRSRANIPQERIDEAVERFTNKAIERRTNFSFDGGQPNNQVNQPQEVDSASESSGEFSFNFAPPPPNNNANQQRQGASQIGQPPLPFGAPDNNGQNAGFERVETLRSTLTDLARNFQPGVMQNVVIVHSKSHSALVSFDNMQSLDNIRANVNLDTVAISEQNN